MIRKGTIKDLDFIVQYNWNLAKETENLELNRDTLKNGVTSVLKDSNKGVYYVYEDEGKVIGQLMITYEWSDWRNATIYWIQSVYVNKDYRQKGIFKALFDHIKTIVSNDESICDLRLYVEKENCIAQNTYQNVGMKQSHYYLYQLLND